MSLSGSTGESSNKRQENGDISTETERPLKKARFAWQVKGKYHLRNEINEDTSANATTSESENTESSTDTDNDSRELAGSTEQNLEILGDYLLKQDFNTLDTVITESEKSVLKPSRDVVPESIHYPRYIASYDNADNKVPDIAINSKVVTGSISSTGPMSMVNELPIITEEQCIARWQARQMAKGFVDNTINRVLDSWMIAPLPADMDNNRFLALDVADFINNLPGANSIENEGILMAISAHGLQNTSNSSTSSKENNTAKIDESCNLPITLNNSVFPSPPSSPVSSDDEILEKHNCTGSCEKSTNYNNVHSQCSCSTETKTALKSKIPFNENNTCKLTFPYTSSQSHTLQEETKTDNFYRYLDGDENTSGNYDIFADHYDFMDAAVSFAIQNKGLTSYGTDCG